ncbi:hypothetical protein FHS89_002630 [Rubricella aquisinus]|uniref:Uncharacterized protein n=1 Tax=Rubricella aquisinus TaxID=2028108 RepID=A0A840WNG7_9RHOB|nr:hypothetical protein [Rubricella aquisinus]MBB5516599.1 hypothetical protein [Rubricella aquisinus]
MTLISDGLLIIGALAASLYCFVLAGRLKRLMALDRGLGASIAGLSRQVDEMHKSLAMTRTAAGESSRDLAKLTSRAEIAAGRLELLLATVHERKATPVAKPVPAPRIDPRAELLQSLRDVKRAMR